MNRRGKGFGLGLSGNRGFGSSRQDASSGYISRLSYTTPPSDFSRIGDSNLVVSFKSLSKKHESTITKALEEILACMNGVSDNKGSIETAILDAWCENYPRLTINNSRRVRELSHMIQHQVFLATKSKLGPYLPQIFPIWLSGCFDKDRAARTAAEEGLQSILQDPAQRSKAFKKHQEDILSHVRAAFDETPSGLNDERSMSVDDLEASYNRLIGSCVGMVTRLIDVLPDDDLQRFESIYEDLLGDSKLLKLTYREDPSLRQETFKLLDKVCQNQPAWITQNHKAISRTLVLNALSIFQGQAAILLVQVLRQITELHSSTWTLPFKSKDDDHLFTLRTFIRKGSQRGSTAFWIELSKLIEALPKAVCPTDVPQAIEMMSAFRAGIANRDEPQANKTVAWNSYFATIDIALLSQFSDGKSRIAVIEATVLPALKNHVLHDPSLSNWYVPSIDNLEVALEICVKSKADEGGNSIHKAVEDEIYDCAKKLNDRLLDPVPHAKQGFGSDQNAISSTFERWFVVLKLVCGRDELRQYFSKASESKNLLVTVSESMVRVCVETLVRHHGKYFGAANGLLSCITTVHTLDLTPTHRLRFLIMEFLEANLSNLLGSPSSEMLLAVLNALRKGKGEDEQRSFNKTWDTTINKILKLPVSDDNQCKYLASVLRNTDSSDRARQHHLIQDFILRSATSAIMNNHEGSWLVLDAAANSKAIADDAVTDILRAIELPLKLRMDRADLIDQALAALKCLAQNGLLNKVNEGMHDHILADLISVKYYEPGDHEGRVVLINEVAMLLSASTDGHNLAHRNAVVRVIKSQLTNVSDISINVKSLLDMADSVVDHADSSSLGDVLSNTFPTNSNWESALQPLVSKPVPGQANMCEFFGTAGALTPRNNVPAVSEVDFDHEGHSKALRMALYGLAVMRKHLTRIPFDQASQILQNLCVTSQLLSSQHFLGQSRLVYRTTCDQFEQYSNQLKDLLVTLASNSSTWKHGQEHDRASSGNTTNLLGSLADQLLVSSRTTDNSGYWGAKALRYVFYVVASVNGPRFHCTDMWLAEHGIFGKGARMLADPLSSLAVATGFGQTLKDSALAKAYCNVLVAYLSDIKDLEDDTARPQILTAMVLLNGTMTVWDEDDLPPQSVRLQMLVNKILSWFEDVNFQCLRIEIASESCRLLKKVLPSLLENSGNHWDQTCTRLCFNTLDRYVQLEDTTIDNPESNSFFVLSHNALELWLRLHRVKKGPCSMYFNTNYDIQKNMYKVMVKLLQMERMRDSPAQEVFDESLSVALLDTRVKVEDQDLDDFYYPLGTPFPVVQGVAYTMLNRRLPSAVEDMVVDAVYGEKIGIPLELQSLLLSSDLNPTNISDPNAEHIDNAQKSRRSVLLAWAVVFRMLELVPPKSREALLVTIKDMSELPHLFNFIEHTFKNNNKLSTLSRVGITESHLSFFDVLDTFQPAGSIFSVRWLTAYLYTQSLLLSPSLVTHWLNSIPHGRKKAIEEWTTREFSPYIITRTVSDIRAWTTSQAQSDPTSNLQIKLPTKAGKTILIEYEVDAQTCALNLTFPPSYPLGHITADSVSRVAVSQTQWDKLMLYIKGAIRFSGGSVIDGIKLFKRNIERLLEGVEQCSICYSIVDEASRLPEKECGVCRNRFHAGCIGKWFKSSNGNTCPMCRQPFGGPGRAMPVVPEGLM